MFKIPWFKPPKPLTEIDQLVIQLEKANLSYYYNAYSSDLSNVKIISYASHVIQYIKVIDYLISLMDKDELLNRHQLPHDIQYLYLQDWFRDEESNFINVEETLKLFIDKTVTLLTLFQEKEMAIDKPFNVEKNLFFMQHIINNLIIICRSFLQ